MKSKVLSILTLVAVILASCSKEDSKMGPDPELGEESVVSLTIYDGTVGSRAADTNTDPATPGESAIDPAQGLKVVVFNENGTIDYPASGGIPTLTLTETSPGSGTYETDNFTVTAGNKYFYVFANDGNNNISSLSNNRANFIRQAFATTFNSSNVLDITDPNFLMGTLWSGTTIAPGGGTTANPEVVPLTIGRLTSKVTLSEVSKGTQSNMLGSFTDPEYRLGTIPKKIFYVGNNDENISAIPPANGHGVVVSAVHSEPIYTGPADPNFYQYTALWKTVDDTTPESFYTIENTTEPDANGIQYYGNTSYIQISTTYTPDDSEVYNIDLTPKGSFTGGSGTTFYTAKLISDGETLIFEDNPADPGADPDIDQSSILEYTNGLNYHKFAIYDNQAGLPDVQKNTVLRNHSYLYKVTSIANLGSHTYEVDPREPIENPTTLKIEVTVLPWSKIEENNVPI